MAEMTWPRSTTLVSVLLSAHSVMEVCLATVEEAPLAMAKPGLQRRPHALALPFPFQGHINPLMELSRKLAAEGVVVSFLNIPHYHSYMAASLQPLLQRQNLPIRLISLSDSHPPPPDLRLPGSFDHCLRRIATFMPAEVETLMHTLDPNLPVTCLIADIRIPFAQTLADKFRIPRVAFWTQSAASYAYHAMISDGFRLPTDESVIIDSIPGVPAHTISDTAVIFREDIIGSFIFDFITEPFRQIAQAAAVVINTFGALESEAMESLCRSRSLLSVGPLLPPAFVNNSAPSPENTSKAEEEEEEEEERHDCLRWLDAHPPTCVLYISFGTVVFLEEKEFKELAHGIEASGQRFLWSLRPDMVTGNPRSFVEAFTERTKDRGFVVPWAPQLEVLSHPAIGGFLTHCGWNSSLESMCRGVPMIGWPKFGEQTLNLRCLVEVWKVCLAMEGAAGGSVRREEVEKKVRMLMEGQEGKEIRSSAGKVKQTASLAMAEGGSSLNNFKRLLELVAGKV